MIKKRLLTFFSILAIFLIDRLTKIYVINLNSVNENINLHVSSFLNINLIWNEGIAFGLLSYSEKSFYHLISILILCIIIYLAFNCFKLQNKDGYFYILITGGAIGNLYDRILFNAVPDFIDFHINDFHWFIFNIADIFITIGIICLITSELFINKKNKDEKF